MGSYSAPSFAVGAEKATQDLATAPGTILCGPTRCLEWLAEFNTDVGYDGSIDVELQLKDDSWSLLETYDNGQPLTFNIGPWRILDLFFAGEYKYPFNVRFKAGTTPTLSTCVCYLSSIPGPANPLF